MRFIYFFLVVLFFKESFSACIDKFALSSISALVHKQRNSKAILRWETNFNLLDEYITVDVTKANVSQLCEGMVKNFPILETLSLINVNLTLIEAGTFQNVPKLKYLSLSVNQLTTIPRDVFNTIPNLSIIYLTQNQIATIEDGAFAQMPNLKAVHLNHNRITQLTGNIFFGSPKVSVVDFSYNLLKSIPKNAFDDLKPGNNVRVLNIHLEKNEIADIEKGVLKELIPVNLHLESNKISLISEAVFSAREGSSLYFTHNLVEWVADDAIEWVKGHNIVVNLKNNPVDCGCIERIDKMLVGELKGELNIESTLPCQDTFSFFGNSH